MSWLTRVIGKAMRSKKEEELNIPSDPEQMQKEELYREAARLAAQISSIAAEANQVLGRIRDASYRHDHQP